MSFCVCVCLFCIFYIYFIDSLNVVIEIDRKLEICAMYARITNKIKVIMAKCKQFEYAKIWAVKKKDLLKLYWKTFTCFHFIYLHQNVYLIFICVYIIIFIVYIETLMVMMIIYTEHTKNYYYYWIVCIGALYGVCAFHRWRKIRKTEQLCNGFGLSNSFNTMFSVQQHIYL